MQGTVDAWHALPHQAVSKVRAPLRLPALNARWRAAQWTRDHFAYNFDCERGMVSTRIFAGARTNIAFNCLDRHVEAGRGNQPCFLWEARAWDGRVASTVARRLVVTTPQKEPELAGLSLLTLCHPWQAPHAEARRPNASRVHGMPQPS